LHVANITPKLILASASPRRHALLAEAQIAFETQHCTLEEPRTPPAGVAPAAWAQALAYFKARAVADTRSDADVLGADTIVACDGALLGKPDGLADARRMLETQAGRPADVITGVALLCVARGQVRRRWVVAAQTRVWMRDDRDLREAYLAGGEWEGKAGAYGIQDVGDALVERIEGSFSNVVGLPVALVRRLLAGRARCAGDAVE